MSLDADVTAMIADVLDEHGVPCVYARASSSIAVNLCLLRPQGPVLFEAGNGMVVEIERVDIIFRTSDLPYGDPIADDHITIDSVKYLAKQISGEKVFRRLSPQLTRIHTVQVH